MESNNHHQSPLVRNQYKAEDDNSIWNKFDEVLRQLPAEAQWREEQQFSRLIVVLYCRNTECELTALTGVQANFPKPYPNIRPLTLTRLQFYPQDNIVLNQALPVSSLSVEVVRRLSFSVVKATVRPTTSFPAHEDCSGSSCMDSKSLCSVGGNYSREKIPKETLWSLSPCSVAALGPESSVRLLFSLPNCDMHPHDLCRLPPFERAHSNKTEAKHVSSPIDEGILPCIALRMELQRSWVSCMIHRPHLYVYIHICCIYIYIYIQRHSSGKTPPLKLQWHWKT